MVNFKFEQERNLFQTSQEPCAQEQRLRLTLRVFRRLGQLPNVRRERVHGVLRRTRCLLRHVPGGQGYVRHQVRLNVPIPNVQSGAKMRNLGCVNAHAHSPLDGFRKRHSRNLGPTIWSNSGLWLKYHGTCVVRSDTDHATFS